MTNMDPNKKDVHGTSKVTPVAKKGGMPAWLPWVLALLGILLLLLLFRGCMHRAAAPVTNTTETTTTTTTNTSAAPATPPVEVEKVTLPGGQALNLAPNTLNYELQRFLASSHAPPRRFTFDHLNFATNSAELPADAQATVSALAQILAAYPNVKVELAGYADASGSDPHNLQLGAQRAEAVQKALAAQGVGADRMKTATGGSSHPVDTNADASGRAENRRTELVVTSK